MHNYALSAPPARRSTQRARTIPECFTRRGNPTVVTVLEPPVRTIIDGATNGTFVKVHVDSVADAIQAVHEHAATALLLSPSVARHYSLPEIHSMVVKTPGATPVAVLADDWPTSHDALLSLGACGVRQVINLAEREGWDRLRALVDQVGGECGQFVCRELLAAAESTSADFRRFLAVVVRVAPETTTVRRLSAVLEIDASTLMSRFFRARLPPPKRYLSMTRLVYAAYFLEMPKVSVAATANALNFSSPQSFERHVRSVLGLTAGEFRRELNSRAAIDHYINRLIVPHLEKLRDFNPLASTTN